MALGTLVRIEKSSYRRIGARILVLENGQWVGGISGGCLEGDALKQAKKAMINNCPYLVTYDTTQEDHHQIGIGLGCKGKIEVLFTPIQESQHPFHLYADIVETRTPILTIQGMFVNNALDEKSCCPFKSDEYPKVAQIYNLSEKELKKLIDDAYANKSSTIHEIVSENGDKVALFFEYFTPEIQVFLAGYHYDIHAMVKACYLLGWKVNLIAPVHKIDKSLFHQVHSVVDYNKIKEIVTDEYSAVVLMTHDYDRDGKLFPLLYNERLFYFGMLGPRSRNEQLLEELFPAIKPNVKEDIHTPIGLDIGALTPEEIAIAVTAEIIAAFRKRKGGFLKYRKGSIH